ncbi:IS30 family transposase [Janibacter anophelis]|uniref:IS30 family transposase n=1 Tax=Janibacter anophelis TaxID=319054 RepID=UPI001F0794A6|nr:IS30 family transposase [Janibacter anophelis]
MVRRQQAADRAVRPKLRSPGHPKFQRRVVVVFWEQIAKGVLPEQASETAGVAQAVGARWFHNAGGMPPFDLSFTPTGRYLSFAEREEIALLRAQNKGVREIARQVGRDPGTISRELRRNAATRGGKLEYRASVAQWKADLAARRPKAAKLVTNPRLRSYVQDRLSGQITLPDGTVIPGPAAPRFTGRNKPFRKDRPWFLAWSPERISQRLKVDFPEDESMRISHEAIYQSLYIEGRGALKRELVWCLRTGRALRVPRERSRRKTWAHVTPGTLISERPAEVEDRAVPGHWEGDLIIGLGRSAIGTVIERKTKFTLLVHLPREEGYRHKDTPKNGPALGGYGAVAMKNALSTTMSTLPAQLARSVTWDRGKEMSAHAQFKIETGIPVFFADPHSPWQRGTNENTNGLLRRYFPKGTDLARWGQDELQAVAHALNTRPRKALGWKTPEEAFNEELLLLEQAGVASTS